MLPSIVKIMRRKNVHYMGKVESYSMLKQEIDYNIDCCKMLIYYRRSEKTEHLLILSIYDAKIGLNYRMFVLQKQLIFVMKMQCFIRAV